MASQQLPFIRRAVMRARAAAFLFSVTLLAVAACADGDLFNPNRDARTQLALRPSFAVNTNAAAMADVNQVRVTVHQLPGNDIVAQTVQDVDPAATSYSLNLDVPANSDLRILIELLNTVGGVSTVQFSGVIDMSVGSGVQEGPPAEVPVVPGGPENLNINSVTISPRDRTIAEGESFRFTANVSGGPANPAVLWTSLNSTVATVAADGTVTGVAPGSATIVAIAGRTQDAVQVEVGPGASSIQITPSAPGPIGLGTQVTFTGRVIGSNGQILPLAITWTAADPTIATQVSPGVFRGARVGTTQITATAAQGSRVVTGSVSLSVEQRPLTVTVSPPNAFIRAIGETTSLTATARDPDNTEITGQTVSWSSSNPAVASVDGQGVVTAHSNGTARIRATILGFTGEAEVVVSQTATSLILSPSEHTLESLGETVQLEADIRDASGNPVDARVEWSTSNAQAATVSETGLVTATGDGFAVISASVTGAQASATIFITRVVAAIELVPAEFQVGVGGTVALTAMAVDANEHLIPDVPLVWSSSDTEVATVDANGVVTGMHLGVADITATSGSATGTAHASVVETGAGGGGDLIVNNDIDIFDSSAGSVQWMKNLIDFSGTGPRASGTKVWMECGRQPIFGTDWCHRAPPLEARFTALGYTSERHTSTAGTLTAIPNDVKLIIFWMPTAHFTTQELTVLRAFVQDGGRVFYIGEHSGFSGTFAPEIQLLRTFGSSMNIQGDCLFGTATIGPPHQLNAGMTDFPVNCASYLVNLGANDAPVVLQSGHAVMVAVTPGPPIVAPSRVSGDRVNAASKENDELIRRATELTRERIKRGEKATDRPNYKIEHREVKP